MRVIGFTLLALLFIVGMLWLGPPTPVEIHGRSFHETRFEERADGVRFLVPYEHSFRRNRNPLWDVVGFFLGSGEEPSSFLVDFSAAWLSAHIDGYQPVLNNRLEGNTSLILSTRDDSPTRPIDPDLWYGRDHEVGRVVLEQREPNTGMQMIVYPRLGVIDPFSDGALIYLMNTPPRPDRDYPLDPPWRIEICRHSFPGYMKAIGEEVKKITSCLWRFHVVDGVRFNMRLSGENLSLRSEVGHAVSREVMHWMLMAAKQSQSETP